ncbi:putative radical SAM enzyme, TIGR03279 family [Carboxydocella thermautotrophica]|nr:putative radical SAM enzyme, TIGR03279 family [Carboxydocella thermautotrophica]
MTQAAVIASVQTESFGERIGLKPGDRILAVNGEAVRDLIDMQFALAEEKLSLTIERSGAIFTLSVQKQWNEDLGIELESAVFDGIRRCANRCKFCFVEQMPPGMRESLYVKDDDYRLSVLHGNFITLTNLREEDLQRIEKLHLSPLYVSVHTTNPELRQELMGNRKAGQVLQQLQRLAAAGIELHTQIVCVPDYNDREELDKTVADLVSLYPQVQSIAVVPVGLTAHRNGLAKLRTFTSQEAANLIDQVERWQEKNRQEFDCYLVYAADEFYLMAGRSIPENERYEDFPQLENGVGLVRTFLDNWEDSKEELPKKQGKSRKALWITGVSFARVLQQVAAEAEAITGAKFEVLAVPNRFFGPTVTVTGLLTGEDILAALSESQNVDVVFLPDIIFRRGEMVTLDGMTVDEIADKAGVKVEVISSNGEDLVVMIKRWLTGE